MGNRYLPSTYCCLCRYLHVWETRRRVGTPKSIRCWGLVEGVAPLARNVRKIGKQTVHDPPLNCGYVHRGVGREISKYRSIHTAQADQVLDPDLWIFGAAAAAFDSTVSAADLGVPTRVPLLHDDVICNETRPRLSFATQKLV
ncbi:unnamed protein product [Ectocarpus sp. 12 AP-2014]